MTRLKAMPIAEDLRAMATAGHAEAALLREEADRLDGALRRWTKEGTRVALEGLLAANSAADQVRRHHNRAILPRVPSLR